MSKLKCCLCRKPARLFAAGLPVCGGSHIRGAELKMAHKSIRAWGLEDRDGRIVAIHPTLSREHLRRFRLQGTKARRGTWTADRPGK